MIYDNVAEIIITAMMLILAWLWVKFIIASAKYKKELAAWRKKTKNRAFGGSAGHARYINEDRKRAVRGQNAGYHGAAGQTSQTRFKNFIMIVLKKAFTAFLSKEISGYDCDISEIVYGQTASKARYMAFKKWDFDNPKIMTVIKVKRAKQSDLVESIPHELVQKLSSGQKDKMLHTLGFSNTDHAYRNRYQCSHDDDYEGLIAMGLADKREAIGLNFYFLTELGQEVILSTRPITREVYKLKYGIKLF